MIGLAVTVENESVIATAMAGMLSQIPFATSLALNNTANDAQQAIQGSLPSRFILRHADFIERTIYRKPGQDFATKTNLVAAVRVNPERNFLAKFEDDTRKTATSGHKLAVPILREATPSLIIQRGDPLSIKSLMQAISDAGGKLGKRQRGKKLGPVRQQSGSVYLVKSAKGTFVVQRTGPDTTRVLYAFESSVPITPDLHFDQIAESVAVARWQPNMEAALDRAIATARA